MEFSLFRVAEDAERCLRVRDTDGLNANLRLLGSMHQPDKAKEIERRAQKRGLPVELDLPKELRRAA